MPEILEDYEASLRLIIQYAKEAEAQGAELVCFPECYLQGYVVNERTKELAIDFCSDTFQNILDRLSKIHATLVIGVIEIHNQNLYNTAMVVQRGKLIGVYRKTNLLGGEAKVFQPGSEFPAFETKGLRFGIAICNDLNYSKTIDAISAQGIDLLVCPCNNMMTKRNAEDWKYRHNEVRASRAKESNTWLLTSDVTGETGDRISYGPTTLIDPDGTVTAQVPLLEPGLLVRQIPIGSRQH